MHGIWLPPYLPAELVSQIHLPASYMEVNQPQNADIRLDVGSDARVATWIYVLVAPFPTVPDEIKTQTLHQFWSGNLDGDFPAQRLIMDGSTQTILAKLWGSPDLNHVTSLSSKDLLETAWQEKTTWAIIPFEELQPQWKVIRLDGQSPIEKICT